MRPQVKQLLYLFITSYCLISCHIKQWLIIDNKALYFLFQFLVSCGQSHYVDYTVLLSVGWLSTPMSTVITNVFLKDMCTRTHACTHIHTHTHTHTHTLWDSVNIYRCHPLLSQ